MSCWEIPVAISTCVYDYWKRRHWSFENPKSEIDENLVSVLRDIQEVFGTEAFFKDDAEELDSDDKFMTVSIKE